MTTETRPGNKVIFKNGTFIWTGKFRTKDVPKTAGFKWFPEPKQWMTVDPEIARKLFDFASPEAKAEMGADGSVGDTADFHSVILTGLRTLSIKCDYAKDEDGMGFSKSDTGLGHALALKTELTPEQAILGLSILRIHKSQLPEWILSVLEPFMKAL